MKPNLQQPPAPSGALSLDSLIEDLTRKVQAREPIDVGTYAARYPQHAERLQELLPGIQLLADLGESSGGRTDFQSVPLVNGTDSKSVLQADEPISGVLGDFHILREIGRGGMGVVYEAEQISLRRQVALKVLPFAGILDSRQLQRFKNEAQAAAGLHHPHIVPVHAVGVDRGVHFYAMQYIEGRTLADVIAAVRGESGIVPPAVGPHTPSVGVQPDTSPIAKLTTDFAHNAKAYARRVAEIGIQAAEALDYAHQLGIVHRDVKPSNLILDERGDIWVTDFGLAITPTGGALTQTGEMVGTLRYMSPEQLVAERGIIDHRTDVYSLGATLYELLTLQPLWGDSDKPRLVRHILEDDAPIALRTQNPGVPDDLQTIVLKMLEKLPADRYATAGEVAHDIRRFLSDEAIVARKQTLGQTAMKWARKRWRVISTAAISLAFAMALVSVLIVRQAQERASKATEVAQRVVAAMNDATRLQGQAQAKHDDLALWSDTLAAVDRAEAMAAIEPADGALLRQVQTLKATVRREAEGVRAELREAERDAQMLADCESARLEEALGLSERGPDRARTADAFYRLFRDYGIDLLSLSEVEAAHRIRQQAVRADLINAILHWSFRAPDTDNATSPGRQKLLKVTSAAATDDPLWHRPFLRAITDNDNEALHGMAAEAAAGQLPVEAALQLTNVPVLADRPESLFAMLLAVRQQCPDDFWVNVRLAEICNIAGPENREDELRFNTAAVAIRPDSPFARLNLISVLYAARRWDEAAMSAREAARRWPELALTHRSLGDALGKLGRSDEAIAAYSRAIEINPDYYEAHNNLGIELTQQGRLQEGVAAYRKALRLRPDVARVHVNLGKALVQMVSLEEAAATLREAIRIDPENSVAHHWLGVALDQLGDLAGAERAFREVVRLKPDDCQAHTNLGTALLVQGRHGDAIACYRDAIRLDADVAEVYVNLGVALVESGRLEEAIAAYEDALRLNPQLTAARENLNTALARRAQADAAKADAESPAPPPQASAVDCGESAATNAGIPVEFGAGAGWN